MEPFLKRHRLIKKFEFITQKKKVLTFNYLPDDLYVGSTRNSKMHFKSREKRNTRNVLWLLCHNAQSKVLKLGDTPMKIQNGIDGAEVH